MTEKLPVPVVWNEDCLRHEPGVGLHLGDEAFGELAGQVALEDIRAALAALAAAEAATE